jgi:hypothetical protein
MFSTTYEPFLSDLFHYCSKPKRDSSGLAPMESGCERSALCVAL